MWLTRTAAASSNTPTATLQFSLTAKAMKFNLDLANDDSEWDALVATSPQGSVFSNGHYLRALGTPFARYVVRTPHGEVLAGMAVMENSTKPGMHAGPFPFVPYQGILFCERVAAQPCHKRVTMELRLTEYIIQSLIEHYGDFSMSLSPAFDDIRPFLWHNYHEMDARHFTIHNRYTALLNIASFQLESYLMSIRTVRRQEFNKSVAEIVETTDVEAFVGLYLKTFERQDIAITQEKQAMLRSIVTSSLTNGYGRLSMAVTVDGVASMMLFIFDQHCAYYLLGANDYELRKSGASTALMVDNICSMSERGLSLLDFVGVNSPTRGDFKLSFNPKLTAYHEVQLDAPSVRSEHST